MDKVALFDSWRGLIDGALARVPQSLAPNSKTLQSALRYVLEGGGKRLRGLLVLSLVSDMAPGEGTFAQALACATAVEVLHAASLVHDDLPALDDDDIRRGRPSCHKAFDEATAILVGDILIAAAFSSIAESVTSAEQGRLLTRQLAHAWRALCEGQQLDLAACGESSRNERVLELKTGALFGFAATAGAISADRDLNLIEQLHNWGVRVGVAFQKLDDIEDGERSQDEMPAIERQVQALIGDLSSICKIPVPLTEAITGIILDKSGETIDSRRFTKV